jgi:hypothetical protein
MFTSMTGDKGEPYQAGPPIDNLVELIFLHLNGCSYIE